MAKYEHLPIFRKSMELSLYLESIVRNFSRYHKYTVGAELRDLSRGVVRSIVRANSAQDKQKTLSELVEQCEMLKIMLVFAKEAKVFSSFKSFQHASSLAVDLCRQSTGWLKSSRKSRNQQPSERMGS